VEIYAKKYFISIFSGFSITILSYTLILSVSQLQTEQSMTSQIRSNIEYLIQKVSQFTDRAGVQPICHRL